MADQSGLIHWRCDAAGHQQAPNGRTADTLTVHDGQWAYCPRDVAASGHVWTATNGVLIEMLRRSSPTISLDVDVPSRGIPAAAIAARKPARTAAALKKTTPKV